MHNYGKIIHFHGKIGNALSALVKKGRISDSEAEKVWSYSRQIPVQLKPVDIGAALSLAVQAGIYAYDAYFIHTAISYRTPLLTFDRGIMRVAREAGIEVLEVS